MLHVLSVVLPVFGLIGLGFAARIAGLVSDRAAQGLSEFVFNIAIPALIFRTLTRADLPAAQPWGYWLAYFLAVALVWSAGSLLALRWARLDWTASIVAGFASAQSNTVFVGVPLILEAYGQDGAVPLFLLLAVHLPIMVTTGSILIEGSGMRFLALLRQLLTNPILLGILASVVVRVGGLPLPGIVNQVVDPIAGAASPCALFAMGIALRRYGLGENWRLGLAVTLAKLVVHPALVMLLAFRVFSMPPAWAGVAVLFAASPCGLNAYLFAERYRSGVGLAAGAITASTVLSIVTTAAWLAILRAG